MSEEKIRWKQEEEEPSEKQNDNLKERYEENKKALLAVGSYDKEMINPEEDNERKSEFSSHDSGQHEEPSEKHTEDQREKFIESKKALLAAGPYDMEVDIVDEKEGKLEKEISTVLEINDEKEITGQEEYPNGKIVAINSPLGSNSEKNRDREHESKEGNNQNNRESIIEIGKGTVKTGKKTDLKNLTDDWNKYVEKGGRITPDMWDIYNKVQGNHDKPLVLYKEFDSLNAYKMSPSGKLFFQLDSDLFDKRLNNPSKQISKLFDYWLIQQGKKEGIKPFFEVTIKNPNNKEIETYWIPNAKQRVWNPYEAKNQGFFYGGRSAGGMVTRFLTTKMTLNQENFKLYQTIEETLRKKYPRIGVQTGNLSFNGQKILFRTFYRLNYPIEVNDEAIELIFWKYVNSRPDCYIRNTLKISELIVYCEENRIHPRKDISQMKILGDLELVRNDQDEIIYPKKIAMRPNIDKNGFFVSNSIEDVAIANKEKFINSRPKVYRLLAAVNNIENNFGLNGLLPAYKPPKNLIVKYDNSYENKLSISLESEYDQDLTHALLEGFGLSTKTDIRRGAFWFGKIVYPMKSNVENVWYRFNDFISSSCERKIENHDKWFPSKHAGGEKAVRRRINVEIDLPAFNLFKSDMIENGRILANENIHRKWVSQTRADARRSKNPKDALSSAEEKITWWNNLRTLTPIDSTEYQKQAPLFILNTKKSGIECLSEAILKHKVSNNEILKIIEKFDLVSPSIKLIDNQTGKKYTMNDVMPVEEINRLGRAGIVFDVFNEHFGANIAFKAQLDFYNKYYPSQSPLVDFLHLKINEIEKCKIELQWGGRGGYPNTGVSMTDTFAPDVVIRNQIDEIIAIIQLKGYSQTKTSMQPNGSVFQMLALKKYELNPKIKTALINVNQVDEFIRFEWLTLNNVETPTNNLIGEFIREGGFKKHPELDPLIPRNLRKREMLDKVYGKIIESDLVFDISTEFPNIITQVLDSERNFKKFIGVKSEDFLTEGIVAKYLNELKPKLQVIVNQLEKLNGIDSYGQFKYHWEKEVMLDYFGRIKRNLERFDNNR